MNCYSNALNGASPMQQNKGGWCSCGPAGCPVPNPIVMPSQICINRRMIPQEQPVIVPIERRTINQCCYYPRYYPVYQNTFYTQY